MRVKAPSNPSIMGWKHGDVGVVEKVCPFLPGPGKRATAHLEDLYFVRMDVPRVSNQEVCYLTYKELEHE